MPNNPKAARGSEEARAWARQRAAEMGLGVKRAREKAGLSAAKLEEKTRELGYPVTRGTIAKIEGGHRDGKFDVAEVVILATALGVAPIDIVYPPTAMPVEYLPGHTLPTGSALMKFTNSHALSLATERGDLIRTFDRRQEDFLTAWATVENNDNATTEDKMRLDAVMVSLGLNAEELQRNWEQLRQVELVDGDDPRAPDYETGLEIMKERRAARGQRRENDG